MSDIAEITQQKTVFLQSNMSCKKEFLVVQKYSSFCAAIS